MFPKELNDMVLFLVISRTIESFTRSSVYIYVYLHEGAVVVQWLRHCTPYQGLGVYFSQSDKPGSSCVVFPWASHFILLAWNVITISVAVI